jgi:hypothetical protein
MADVTLKALGLVSTQDGLVEPGQEFTVTDKQAKRLVEMGYATKSAAEANKAAAPEDPEAAELAEQSREQVDRNLIAPAAVDEVKEDGSDPEPPPVKKTAAKKP